MITRVDAQGFKSFHKAEVDLQRLNVLIGPNAAGKSNLLDLLGLLSSGAIGSLAAGISARGGFLSLLSAFAGDQTIRVVVHLRPGRPGAKVYGQYEIELGQYGYEVAVREEVLQTFSLQPAFIEVPLLRLLGRAQTEAVFYNEETGREDPAIALKEPAELAISQVRQPSLYRGPEEVRLQLSLIQVYDPIYPGRFGRPRMPTVAAPEWILVPDASNIANVLSSRMTDDGFAADFDRYVKLAFPDFTRIHFRPDPSGQGKIAPSWHSSNLNRPLNIWELSDGAFKYVCLLAVLLRPLGGATICIDEPELGLHPRLVSIVADLLRAAAEDAQVIVTTHSPSLVSQFEPDQVIVVDAPHGQTEFRRLPQPDLSRWLEEFTLGELMTMGKLEREP